MTRPAPRLAALAIGLLVGACAPAAGSELGAGELALACEADVGRAFDVILLPYEPLACGAAAPEHVAIRIPSRDLRPGDVLQIPGDARGLRCTPHAPCVRVESGELEVLAADDTRVELAWSLTLRGGTRLEGSSTLVVCGPPPGDPDCVETCDRGCHAGGP